MKPSYNNTSKKQLINLLESLLIGVKNKDNDFSDLVFENISNAWQSAHWYAQNLEPEKTIDVEKKYIPHSNIYEAEFILNSEVSQLIYTQGKLGNEEIVVNSNDFTVFKVRYFEKL